MCQNAQKTAISLMSAIEPTIISLGNDTGIASNPAFQTVLTEYNNALTAVENWTSGTPAQDAIQIINALEIGVQALPIPATVQTLVNIILAGIATVIGVLSANSPAPAPATTGDATPEEVTAQHSPATQYKNAWNSAVDVEKLPATMKVQ
jgi:hypothetical protein